MAPRHHSRSRKRPQATTNRSSDKFILRLPEGMRDRIAALAREKGRSMNAEVIAALEQYIENDDTIAVLWNKVEDLERTVYEHKQLLSGRDPFNVDK